LQYLENAISIDPKNNLAKYRRAAILAHLGQYKESLEELNLLKIMAPKEAPIYFLMGKIYKKMDDIDNALNHLTIAFDLDSKNANHIKSVIDKLNSTIEDDQQDSLEDYQLS
jgi:anaphase-promoting complex subunit 3